MRYLALTCATGLALSACAPTMPDDAAGFDGYDNARRAQVDATLEGRSDPGTGRVEAPTPVESGGLDGSGSGGGDDIAAMAAAALDGTGSSASGTAFPQPGLPAGATGSTGGQGAGAPPSVENEAGISNENNFDAVSNQRSIEQDAALVEQNRAQYQIIAPEPLPERPEGASGVNVVEYALRTTNSVGQPVYSRSAFASKAREQRNCTAYASDDEAQEAFLAAGGPERDREGLDADGDGFACGWNPAPFRRSRG